MIMISHMLKFYAKYSSRKGIYAVKTIAVLRVSRSWRAASLASESSINRPIGHSDGGSTLNISLKCKSIALFDVITKSHLRVLYKIGI